MTTVSSGLYIPLLMSNPKEKTIPLSHSLSKVLRKFRVALLESLD